MSDILERLADVVESRKAGDPEKSMCRGCSRADPMRS